MGDRIVSRSPFLEPKKRDGFVEIFTTPFSPPTQFRSLSLPGMQGEVFSIHQTISLIHLANLACWNVEKNIQKWHHQLPFQASVLHESPAGQDEPWAKNVGRIETCGLGWSRWSMVILMCFKKCEFIRAGKKSQNSLLVRAWMPSKSISYSGPGDILFIQTEDVMDMRL